MLSWPAYNEIVLLLGEMIVTLDYIWLLSL